MGVSSPLKGLTNLPMMKFLVVLFTSSALALPKPAEEALVAEAEVEQDIAAVPYVHEEIAAEEYVHVEGASAPIAAPVVYTGLPCYGLLCTYAGLPTLTATLPKAEVKAAAAKPVVSPVAYTYGYPHPYGLSAYPYFLHHTGCVNSVGSVVPCAL